MNKTLTLIACTALAMGAIAVPAMAQSDADGRADADERHEKAQEHREAAQERREAAQERREAFHDAREACLEDKQNSTNGTHGRCVAAAAKDRAQHDDASKARRAAHHIHKQIDAVEHRIAKLEMMEYRIEHALEGNVTQNETAELEQKLERIEAAQGKLVQELRELYQKQEALKERWQAHKQGDESDDEDA